MQFKSTYTVKFSQTDMAGICYFNQAFNIFHDQYEEFVQSQIGPKMEWFNNPEWVVPIRHIESEYLKPLMAFETYDVTITLGETRSTSFKLETVIEKNGAAHCKITSSHVFVDKKTFKPRPIPENLAAKFK